MSNQHPSVTSSDLCVHPELAVLEILDSALGMAKSVLIAAHPELTDVEPGGVPSDIEVLAAEHVLVAVDTLQRLTASYRSVINADDCWAQPSLRRVHDDPF
jgi:hypothetical protein